MNPLINKIVYEPTNLGVAIGITLGLVYLLIYALNKAKPNLSQFAVLILSSVAATTSIVFGYALFAVTKEQLGTLAEHRLSMILGAIAVIYISVEEIIKIYLSVPAKKSAGQAASGQQAGT